MWKVVLVMVLGASAHAGDELIKKNGYDISCVTQYLDTVFADCGRYPTTAEGLKALITKPKDLNCNSEGINHWPYIKVLPKDPWGRPWYYMSSIPSHYSLKSLGKDGKSDLSVDAYMLTYTIDTANNCPGYGDKRGP